MRRAAAPLLLLLTLTACAPRAAVNRTAPAPPPPIDLDELLRVGCYRCLAEAFTTVEPRSPEAAFQVATLLALRSKELGLPYETWLERAKALMPAGPEWPLYLEIAGVVRVDPLSGDREDIFALTSSQRRPTETVLGWIEALKDGTASPLFRAYLELTLSCSAGQRQEATTRLEPLYGSVPLIQYRIGTCGSASHLDAVRAAVPAYVDADLPIGRNAAEGRRPDQEEALLRYRAARAAFAASPLITALIGDLHREREEWAEALEAYDATVALVPTHRDALLGRTVALSNLDRHDEAIAAANRIIELGNWLVGGAYFWRAWNHFNLGNIDAARTDVEEARSRAASAPTYVLSGMVAWRQQRLEFAEREFSEAITIDAGQCEASALLGAVRVARLLLAEALAAFEHAQQCFDLSIALRRKLIEEINAGPGSAAGKASAAARHERAIAEAQKNRGDAIQNAAAIQKRLNPSSR